MPSHYFLCLIWGVLDTLLVRSSCLSSVELASAGGSPSPPHLGKGTARNPGEFLPMPVCKEVRMGRAEGSPLALARWWPRMAMSIACDPSWVPSSFTCFGIKPSLLPCFLLFKRGGCCRSAGSANSQQDPLLLRPRGKGREEKRRKGIPSSGPAIHVLLQLKSG